MCIFSGEPSLGDQFQATSLIDPSHGPLGGSYLGTLLGDPIRGPPQGHPLIRTTSGGTLQGTFQGDQIRFTLRETTSEGLVQLGPP